ncbi:MAG: hypothetical protein AAFY99_07835 [Pseudomonadota bacterium]
MSISRAKIPTQAGRIALTVFLAGCVAACTVETTVPGPAPTSPTARYIVTHQCGATSGFAIANRSLGGEAFIITGQSQATPQFFITTTALGRQRLLADPCVVNIQADTPDRPAGTPGAPAGTPGGLSAPTAQ